MKIRIVEQSHTDSF